MFKFNNSKVIGSLIVLFVFFVIFVSSIGNYIQGCREAVFELRLENRDLREAKEKIDFLELEVKNLENEIYEIRVKNSVLNDQINQINANNEAREYLNTNKEVGEWECLKMRET